MEKAGLLFRIAEAKKSKPPLRPLAFAFGGDDDDDDDAAREISSLASTNKALRKVEELHKKAMEEDHSVFFYDAIYDKMKLEIASGLVHDRAEREANYLQRLEGIEENSKERNREHEILKERKLLKERCKEDHLFADKAEFLTSAYKKQLEERTKWLEQKGLHQILEEKEDVTKKSDYLTDFYWSMDKNECLSARLGGARKHNRTQEIEGSQSKTEATVHSTHNKEVVDNQAETRSSQKNHVEHAVRTSAESAIADAPSAREEIKVDQMSEDERRRYKRNEAALAAARERFQSRKRARVTI